MRSDALFWPAGIHADKALTHKINKIYQKREKKRKGKERKGKKKENTLQTCLQANFMEALFSST